MSSKRAVAVGLLMLGLFAATPELSFCQLVTPVVNTGTKMGTIAVEITRFGPTPNSFTLPTGPILLYVSNRSRTLTDTYSVVLKPDSGTSATASQPSLLDLHSDGLTSHHDYSIIQPLPGLYELRFKAHPDWVVNITITK